MRTQIKIILSFLIAALLSQFSIAQNSPPVTVEKPVEIININPNPFNEYTRLEYEVNEPTQFRAMLVDVMGQRKMLTPLTEVKGEQQTSISTSGLEPGIYLLHLMVDGKVVSVHKMVKM